MMLVDQQLVPSWFVSKYKEMGGVRSRVVTAHFPLVAEELINAIPYLQLLCVK